MRNRMDATLEDDVPRTLEHPAAERAPAQLQKLLVPRDGHVVEPAKTTGGNVLLEPPIDRIMKEIVADSESARLQPRLLYQDGALLLQEAHRFLQQDVGACLERFHGGGEVLVGRKQDVNRIEALSSEHGG